MDYFIKADIEKIAAAAKSIRDFLDTYQTEMNGMDKAVNSLPQSWNAQDHSEFQNAWTSQRGNDSLSQKINDEYTNYAEYLEYIVEQYNLAQKTAVDTINSIAS